jgi:hypothetical protein
MHRNNLDAQSCRQHQRALQQRRAPLSKVHSYANLANAAAKPLGRHTGRKLAATDNLRQQVACEKATARDHNDITAKLHNLRDDAFAERTAQPHSCTPTVQPLAVKPCHRCHRLLRAMIGQHCHFIAHAGFIGQRHLRRRTAARQQTSAGLAAH